MPERTRAELEQFFIAATFFEKKDVHLLGWDGPEQARAGGIISSLTIGNA